MRKTGAIVISAAAILLVALALAAYFRKKPKESVSTKVGGVPVPESASKPASGTVIGPALTDNPNIQPCPEGAHIDFDADSGALVCVVN